MKSQVKFQKSQASQRTGTDQFLIKSHQRARHFFELIANLKAKFVLISFNSEGFINQDEFDKNLNKMGKVHLLRQKYNAYRGSRNLKARNIHVDELLYVLKK